MKYREFGKTGEKISTLGFGCMRFPMMPADPSAPEQKPAVNIPEAVALLRHAIDNGVNYVDTAYGYHGGESEKIVGLALRDGYRQRTNLATKFPCWEFKQPGDFDRILDIQLERLQTDHLDFYMLHALSRDSWEKIALQGGVLEQLRAAKASGKVRRIGFSFHDNLDVFKSIVDHTDAWDFCQIQFNYLDIANQAGLAGLRHAAAKGLAVIVMEPLRGGKLADLMHDDVRKVFDGTGKTNTEWALDFVWNHPEVSLLLSGMGTRRMVDENMEYADRASAGMLAPQEMAIIAKAREAIEGENAVPCTGCEYCIPCPAGVAIPSVFQACNTLAKANATKADEKTDSGESLRAVRIAEAKAQYANWVPNFGKTAESCVSCGRCEKRCPQHIAISEEMKKAAASFA